jgi:hypothetical protein
VIQYLDHFETTVAGNGSVGVAFVCGATEPAESPMGEILDTISH